MRTVGRLLWGRLGCGVTVFGTRTSTFVVIVVDFTIATLQVQSVNK